MKRLFSIALLSVIGCSWPVSTPPATSPRVEPPPVSQPSFTVVPPSSRANPPPAKPKIYKGEDLRAALLGLTRQQVKELLGAPDEIETGGGGVWHYRNRVIDPETDQPTRDANVLFKNGEVEFVLFNPPRKGDKR